MGRSADLRLKSGNGSRGIRSESGEEDSQYRCAMIEAVARLQRRLARNLAIQLQRPTWHLCRTFAATWSPEGTALGAGA